MTVIWDLVSLSVRPLSVGRERKSTQTAHCSFRVGDVKPQLCGLCISYGERGLLPIIGFMLLQWPFQTGKSKQNCFVKFVLTDTVPHHHLYWSINPCCLTYFSLFQELLSSEQFYKRYVLSHFNLELEEQPSGLLNMWTDPDNWFCYWAGRGDPNYWIFADPPKRWKCGVVHLAEYELETHRELRYKDFCRALYILSRIQKAAEPEELRLDCSKCFYAKLNALHSNYQSDFGCF